MDNQKRIICRLCFNIQDNFDNFKAIEKDLKDILVKMLHEMDLAAIEYPMMCTNCADTLLKCFDFKAKCINSHDYIIPFINKDTVKVDLIDVYISKNKNCTGVLEVQDVCGLCMGPLKSCSALPVDITLKKMIEQCVPELDMNIIKKPVICIPCHGSLEKCFHFLTNCLIVEEMIKKYCESQNKDSKDEIELSSLLQFRITYVARKVDGSLSDIIKVENQCCENIENADETGIGNKGDAFKFEQMSCDDQENTEELILKSESSIDTDELKFNSEEHFTSKNMLACKEGVIKTEEPSFGENRLKEENLVKMEDQKFVLNEDVEIKTDESDFNRFEYGILPQPKVSKVHLLMHKDPLGVTIYKCNSCSYQVKHKGHIKRHLLKHKDPSEVTMYKCESCSFQTKYKKSITVHLQKHKDPSEVTMYKCESCVYQTTRRDTFELHLLTHKDPSELTMYKCEFCSFQAKHKSYLKKHFLVHKNSSELKMYKCDLCLFETKHKKNLESHLLKHKDPSEVTMYKCDSCSYQAKRKRNIKRHLLKHMDPSELTMYKCSLCSFQAKFKKNLKSHLLKHKDPSEVTMYRCNFCSFQTKYKKSITVHLLNHKDSSEVTVRECKSRPF